MTFYTVATVLYYITAKSLTTVYHTQSLWQKPENKNTCDMMALAIPEDVHSTCLNDTYEGLE